MTSLSSAIPDIASNGDGLRQRLGLGVAVAWVLIHLWTTSSLPDLLADTLGSWVVINSTQERGLMLGFTLCLAFLLFEPRRLKLPPAADLALAAIGALAGSINAWNYAHLGDNPLDPGGFSLAVAFLGMVLLLLACLRVFGWFGWVLVGLVASVHLAPLALGLPVPRALREVDTLLSVHWFTSESIFGVVLGIVTAFGFGLVILSTGYDVMGYGRRLAKSILWPLPSDTTRMELVRRSRIAARLWALVVLYALLGGSGLVERLTFSHVGGPLLVGFAVYAVFLGLAWASRAIGKAQCRDRLLEIGAGGMLLGMVPILSVLLRIADAVFESVFGGLSITLPGPAGSLAVPVLFLVVSLLLIAVAIWRNTPARPGMLCGSLVLMPLLLFLWMLSVDRVSLGLAAAYADILMLVGMAGVAAAGGAGAETLPETERRGFIASYFPALCHGVARVMVRVVILAALSGMLIPWVSVWAPLIHS